MHVIPTKVDFYITNVCNLTCENCNRFNNHDFKGWQRWSDYEETYRHWGQLVKLKAITIMGGEPFLNPTLKDWIQGLNRIFDIEIQVLTNGTRFAQSKEVYSSLLNQSALGRYNNHIGVSLHNLNDWPNMREQILNFLTHPVKEYTIDRPENWWQSDWMFRDVNNVMINVFVSNKFMDASIQLGRNNRFQLYNSDVKEAHENCAFAQFKSYHFIRGKLYKCGPVALMPEFDQQKVLDISDEDRILLNSYKPLGVDNFAEYHKEFFANLDNAIPQCKFCPTQYKPKTIYPLRKGL